MLQMREKIVSRRVLGNITIGFASLPYVQAIVLSKIMCANQKKSSDRRFRISFRLYTLAAMLAAINLNFSMKGKNCGNQNEIFDRNATMFICVIDIIRRSVGQRPDGNRRQYH